MTSWDADKIIGMGLVLALIIYMIIVGLVAFYKDTILPLDIASNIAVGLTGYMGKKLVEKLPQPPSSNNNSSATPDDK